MKHGGKDGDGRATDRRKRGKQLRGALATEKILTEQSTKKEVKDQSFANGPDTSLARKSRVKAPTTSPPPCKRVKLSNSKESKMSKKHDSGTLTFSLTLTF